MLESGLASRPECPLRPATASNLYPSRMLADFGRANAIPAFARKFGVACNTCHTAFPQLNAFGIAFKRNGYEFPGEVPNATDPLVHEKPVALGSDEDTQKFPHTIMPSTIPGSVPLAVLMDGQITSAPRDHTQNNRLNFDNIQGTAEVLMGGTLGTHFSFYGDLAFERATDTDAVTGVTTSHTDVGVERAIIQYKPWAAQPYMLLRVGRIESTVLPVTEHFSLYGDYFMVNGQTRDDYWTMDPAQQGIELDGTVANEKLFYSVGVVEGATRDGGTNLDGNVGGNQSNLAKDFYGNLEYRVLGSMWSSNFLAISAFGYRGYSTLVEGMGNTQNDHFTLGGLSLKGFYKNLNGVLAYTYQRNSAPIFGSPNRIITNQMLAEVTWAAWPWFLPGARYEYRKSGVMNDQRITAALTFLPFYNVKPYLRGTLERSNDGAGTIIGFTDQPQITMGLAAAF